MAADDNDNDDEVKKDEAQAEMAASATEEEEMVPPDAVPMKDLVILAPRQKSADPQSLKLPVLKGEEPVQSLRVALTEVVGFAHMTSYRFELVADGASKIVDWNPEPKSAYTGTGAVVAIPAAFKGLHREPESSQDADDGEEDELPILDDYGTLAPLLDAGLRDGSAFQVVLQRYDGAGVKDHVVRLSSIFDGNVPVVKSLVPLPSANKSEEEEAVQTTGKAPPELPRVSLAVEGTKLRDFYYKVHGEDPAKYHSSSESALENVPPPEKSKKKKKNGGRSESATTAKMSTEATTKAKIEKFNQLIADTIIPCTVRFGGFHPPPPNRRVVGDLAYIEATMPDGQVIHVTAVPIGFYVNKSNTTGSSPLFDPTPAEKPCVSHALLDCLLEASPSLMAAWCKALDAAAERVEIENALTMEASTTPMFHTAVRGDFAGFTESAAHELDKKLTMPGWMVHVPKHAKSDTSWTGFGGHAYNVNRLDMENGNSYGVDVRNGAIRDWNEEVQVAREMPIGTVNERLDRARNLNKAMTDFGDACLRAVKGISDGQLMAMNPMEPARNQIFLHNNIFVSRAIDTGPDTFKVARGDRAAKKAPNREAQCVSTFHRMEATGVYTSAFVLIDYLGTRYICQSILPGILSGENSHTVLCGSVDSTTPLKWDAEFNKLVEDKIGPNLMVASRPIPRDFFTDERVEAIKAVRPPNAPLPPGQTEETDEKSGPIVNSCMPIEAKGILGSDQRKYILDFTRLTPLDANWLPESQGGTGKWEEAKQKNGAKANAAIPSSLDDDEWAMCILRPELVTRFTQVQMTSYLSDKKMEEESQQKQKDEKEGDKEGKEASKETSNETPSKEVKDESPADEEEKEKEAPPEKQQKLSEADVEHLKTLRLNLNVFVKDMRSLKDIDEESAAIIKQDEQRVRDAANYLWGEVLPQVTMLVKQGTLPFDGTGLTELLHRNGVNCRYMGRLATLAQEHEAKDAQTEADLKEGRLTYVERRTMPKVWLEMLECEMLARAARHVLDSYLVENGRAAANQPAQTIASFLSALVSSGEETAGQSENRIAKLAEGEPDEDDINALSIFGSALDGECSPIPVRSRHEVWQDLELEIGRRFRYTLTLFNIPGKQTRARYLPLLRRVCQRTGVRLAAKDYDLGGKALCSGGNAIGGGLTASYPISPVDVVDIVPLMKHSAAYSEGFTPCMAGDTFTIPPLQILLADARVCLERAHIQFGVKALGAALELAQEAASLYQKVIENHMHPSVIESLELLGQILLEAGNLEHSVDYITKSLALSVQVSGFDCTPVLNAHMMLFRVFFGAQKIDVGLKHLKAAIFLIEMMAGPNHFELYNAYHRCGTVYAHDEYKGKYLEMARRMFEEAAERDGCDRLMAGFSSKAYAKCLAELGDYKKATAIEKEAYRALSTFLGKEHKIAKASEKDLSDYTKRAVANGKKTVEASQLLEESAIADAHAADLMAEEEKKNNKKKKKKGKK